MLAVKATTDPVLLAAAAESGAGFDCSTLHEIQAVERWAREGSPVSYTPAAQSPLEDEAVSQALRDLPDIRAHWAGTASAERAIRAVPEARHGLRLFFPDCAPGAPGHYPQSRFGVRLSQVEALARAAESAGGRISSLHVHNGSRQHGREWFAKAYLSMTSTAQAADLTAEVLNLGGGLEHSPGRDLPDTLEALDDVREDSDGELRLEPGGWWGQGLVWLASPVLEVVPGDLCDFVVIDAGAENHRRWSLPSGPSWGPASSGGPHVIAGRTCSEKDYFVQVPPVEDAPSPVRGDWVLLPMTTYSMELQSHFGGLAPLPRTYV